ncbi:MAG: single-stranded DNA-binding protein [Pyrinomonadaceae bacterium]
MSFNKIIIVGNLGRDPELRYTPQGSAVCNISVATSEKRRDKAGDFQDVTTWFRVTLWEKKAETAAKYLTKGTAVYIEGRLRIEEWTDRDGKNRSTLEVHGTDMQFIGSRSDEMSGGGSGGESNIQDNDFTDELSSGSAASTAAVPSDDDIPF